MWILIRWLHQKPADIFYIYSVFKKKRISLCSVAEELRQGAQWLSGRVLDSKPRGRGFMPHLRHWVVSLSKTH